MTTENKYEHHGSGFANGLLLGVIIGAALVFFLGTKRGKRLLKTITDEGFEEIGGLHEFFNEEVDEEEEEEEGSLPVHPDMKEEFRPLSKAKRFFKRKK